MKKIILQIRVNLKDYNLLAKYGFVFDDNINDFLHDIAEQMRQAKQQQRKPKIKA